jgi:hypothetical protein
VDVSFLVVFGKTAKRHKKPAIGQTHVSRSIYLKDIGRTIPFSWVAVGALAHKGDEEEKGGDVSD